MQRIQHTTVWAVLALAIAMFAVVPAASAAPPYPAPGAAIVDGQIDDWDTGIDPLPADDGDWRNSESAPSYFANMYRAGKTDKKVESRLWLRYQCRTETSGTLYALVLAAPGVSIDANGDQFIKDGISKMLVNSGYAADGVPPDFAWVGREQRSAEVNPLKRERKRDYQSSVAQGWEASINVAKKMDPATTDLDLNVHAQVLDGGSQTSAVAGRNIPLVLPIGCDGPPPGGVTATPRFTRTWTWDLEKTADYTEITATTTVTYTVTATPTRTDAYSVTGYVTDVANPTVTAMPDDVDCSVVSSHYTCAGLSGDDGTIVVLDGTTLVDEVGYTFPDVPTVSGLTSVTVQDNYGRNGNFVDLFTATVDSPDDSGQGQSYTYPVQVSPPSSGNCSPLINTARLKQLTGVYDTHTVERCPGPPPPDDLIAPSFVGSARTTYTRSTDWAIEKHVLDTTKPAGSQWQSNAALTTATDSALATYQVKVTPTTTDSELKVSGSMSVRNSNRMTAVTVTLELPDLAPPAGCSWLSPSAGELWTVTVAARSSATRAFECVLATKPAGQSTLIIAATWTYGSSSTEYTANFNQSYSFGNPTRNENPYVIVRDSGPVLEGTDGGHGPVILSASGPSILEYNASVPATTSCPSTKRFINTVGLYLSRSADADPYREATAAVTTCTTGGGGGGGEDWLDAGASASFNGAYTWDVTKRYDGARLSPDGAYVDLSYTVSMRRSQDVFGTNFVVRGDASYTSLNGTPSPSGLVLGLAVPGVAGSVCWWVDPLNPTRRSRYIEVPGGLLPLEGFNPTYVCGLSRRADAEVVIALYNGSVAVDGATFTSGLPLDSVRAPYFFGMPTSFDRAVIDVWDVFDGGSGVRTAVVSTDSRSVSYVNRVPVPNGDLSRCALYENRVGIYPAASIAKPDDPTSWPAALDEDAEAVYFCPWTDMDPLEVRVSLSPSYLRSFDWSIAKSVGKPEIGDDGTAILNYTVDATKSDPVETDYAVDGAITVVNPNPFWVRNVTIRNDAAPAIYCSVTDVSSLTFEPYQTRRFPFTCTPAGRSTGSLTATVRGSGVETTIEIEPYDFATAVPRDVNGSVTVFDRFGTDLEEPIPGGVISASARFAYKRTVELKRGCVVYPNTARLASVSGLVKYARASAQICLQADGDVVYIDEDSKSVFVGKYRKGRGTAAGGLEVTKTGPSRASRGQVVSYRIKVVNGAFERLTGITLTDALPAGMRFQGPLPAGGVQLRAKGRWTFSLAAGASRTFTLRAVVAPTASGRLCNAATVRTAAGDTDRSVTCLRVAGVPKPPKVTG